MMLVKLGGSLITDKSRLKTFRTDRMKVLAQELGMAGVDMILVHGAGSFGHILAKEHRLKDGYANETQIPGVSHVQRDVRTLNLLVMDSLIAEGLKPVSLPPSTVVRMSGGELESMDFGPFRAYLGLGLLPVTFGDVVIDSRRKFSICSGDDLMLWLAREFKPEKAVFAADVDGVYQDYPPVEGEGIIDRLDWDTYRTIEGGIQRADVTGGILRKLRLMFDIADADVETWVVNGSEEGRLMKFLMGHDAPGTRITRR